MVNPRLAYCVVESAKGGGRKASRQRDCRHVEKRRRYFAFDIAAGRFGQHRGGAVCANDRALQQRPGDPRQQQREAIFIHRSHGLALRKSDWQKVTMAAGRLWFQITGHPAL